MSNESLGTSVKNSSAVSVFENPTFGSVRTIIDEKGEPLFCGKDVAMCLGYADTDKAIRNHVDEEDKTTINLCDFDPDKLSGSNFSSKTREVIFINESGVYSLILRSKLESAKAFKRWVSSEVLPSIRKTGSYSMVKPQLPQTYADALRELAATVEEKERLALENKHQSKQIAEDAPKVTMYNDLMNSDGLVNVAEFAKMMDIGSKSLYATLRSMGMLTLKNLPYQTMITKGFFKTKEEPYIDTAGVTRINVKVLITPKGQKVIHEHIKAASTAAELFK